MTWSHGAKIKVWSRLVLEALGELSSLLFLASGASMTNTKANMDQIDKVYVGRKKTKFSIFKELISIETYSIQRAEINE